VVEGGGKLREKVPTHRPLRRAQMPAGSAFPPCPKKTKNPKRLPDCNHDNGDGQKVVYYLADNDVSKAFHKNALQGVGQSHRDRHR